jgi:hypothetical protein
VSQADRHPRFVYLLESRIGRRGKRTRRDHWQAEAAFATPGEAEAFARANERLYFHGWRVTRVAAEGPLRQALAPELSPGFMPDVGL